MVRGLSHGVLASSCIALLLAHANAAGPTPATAGSVPILQRFLALDDPTPTRARALRHLEARNDKFDMSAWMEVWTEIDASGFRYRIGAEDGSGYIRPRVFRGALETDCRIWWADAPVKASFT